uniref:Uncharacterized protein n=1 Tax=Anguilla anguilla TaxID=7936 RepID=A0A0E9S3B2_ANGAN
MDKDAFILPDIQSGMIQGLNQLFNISLRQLTKRVKRCTRHRVRVASNGRCIQFL